MSEQPMNESKTDSGNNFAKFVPTDCDKIDLELISKVKAMPNQSILNQDGYLEFDLLLKLY
jgi:hypothetical protein